MYVCSCIYIGMYLYKNCLYIYIYIYIIYVYICIYVYAHIFICVYVCICVDMQVRKHRTVAPEICSSPAGVQWLATQLWWHRLLPLQFHVKHCTMRRRTVHIKTPLCLEKLSHPTPPCGPRLPGHGSWSPPLPGGLRGHPCPNRPSRSWLPGISWEWGLNWGSFNNSSSWWYWREQVVYSISINKHMLSGRQAARTFAAARQMLMLSFHVCLGRLK